MSIFDRLASTMRAGLMGPGHARALATAAALAATAVQAATKGVANGVASLGADGKVPAAQLSITKTDINTLLIAVAKLKGDQVGMVAGVADDFKDTDGVNAGQSTYLRFNTTTSIIDNVVVATNSLPPLTSNTAPSGYVALANDETGYAAYLAFDGTGAFWQTVATSGWVQLKLAAARTVGAYAITVGGATFAPSAWTLQGSNNGSTWTTIDTRTAQAPAAASRIEYTVATPGSYLYYRLNVTAVNGGTTTRIVELELLDLPAPSALDVRSATYTAAAVPTKASIFVLASAVSGGPIVANTNLIAEASRDNGTTWTAFTLVKTGDLAGGMAVYEASDQSIAAQPSGTSMRWRVRTVGTTLVANLDAVVFQWG
jgi:hypothetical protein